MNVSIYFNSFIIFQKFNPYQVQSYPFVSQQHIKISEITFSKSNLKILCHSTARNDHRLKTKVRGV